MMVCINETVSTQRPQEANIAIAAFVSKDIWRYASHTSLILSLYSEYHGYWYRILSPDTGDDFSPSDRRWNKIKSILSAFHPMKGWARNLDALVYVDADLAVLDFNLSIELYLDSYPDTDLFMSADALDVANSGFLIARNTDWNRSFFAMWWLKKDSKFTFCDQHVFNKLYADKDNSKKIKILGQTALNSIWPAIETFDENLKVLHLMGELMSFREAVFMFGSKSVCMAFDTAHSHGLFQKGEIEQKILLDSVIPRQLGYTREILVHLARYSLQQEQSRLFQNFVSNGNHAIEQSFDSVHEATTNFCDDRRPYVSASREECDIMFTAIKDQLNIMLSNSSHEKKTVVHLLNQKAKVYFDLLYFSDESDILTRSEMFLENLQTLSRSIDMTTSYNQRYIRHKRGIFYGAMASFSYKNSEWGSAINNALASLDEMGVLLNSLDEVDADFSGFFLEYMKTVSLLSAAYKEVGEISVALDWAKLALSNGRHFYENYNGEERLIGKQLGSLFIAVAALQEINFEHNAAIITLDEMKISIDKFGQRLDDSILKAAEEIRRRSEIKRLDLDFSV